MNRSSLAALLLLLAGDAAAVAKPPSLDGLFPPGGRRGDAVRVTASGSFSHWPVRVWTDRPGLEVRPLPEKGTLSVAIAEDARVGVHWLRLYDDEGATALKPFLVGTLPEVVEAEPNDDPRSPQRLDGSALTINGKLARSGDVDGYSLTLSRGQTLVAAIEANRRLGSPLDGLLQVVSAAGFVLAENDDGPDRDPLLVFRATADGTYLVRVFAFPAVPDARIGFAGGDAFVYRLTLTTQGYLDHVYPLAVPRESPGRVEAVGWNIDERMRWLDVPAAADGAEVLPIDHHLLANGDEVRLLPHEAGATVEVEPNAPATPQEIPLPAVISGRIDPARDQDAYRFAGRKGEKWRIRLESRSLGHPLDAVLRVVDASDKVVSEMDDPGGRRRSSTVRDPDLTFTVPADGPYRVVVRDLNDQGSFRHVYRLTVAAPPPPDYALSLDADRFTLTPDRPLKIPVTVARDDGFQGAIEVSAAGLPDEVVAPPVISAPSGPTAKKVTLELCAHQGPWSGPLRILGRSDARPGEPKAATAPAGSSGAPENIWLTIVPPPPTAKGPGPEQPKDPKSP